MNKITKKDVFEVLLLPILTVLFLGVLLSRIDVNASAQDLSEYTLNSIHEEHIQTSTELIVDMHEVIEDALDDANRQIKYTSYLVKREQRIQAMEEQYAEERRIIEETRYMDPALFVSRGTIKWNGHKWTYYSEKVLPGGGLDIPGRHVDEDGFVCDVNGYICLASDLRYIARGTIIDTPFGKKGKIYDTGCDYGTIDCYVSW